MGGLSGMCLRTRCGYFQYLVNLNLGVGEGGSIVNSGEIIVLFFLG